MCESNDKIRKVLFASIRNDKYSQNNAIRHKLEQIHIFWTFCLFEAHVSNWVYSHNITTNVTASILVHTENFLESQQQQLNFLESQQQQLDTTVLRSFNHQNLTGTNHEWRRFRKQK